MAETKKPAATKAKKPVKQQNVIEEPVAPVVQEEIKVEEEVPETVLSDAQLNTEVEDLPESAEVEPELDLEVVTETPVDEGPAPTVEKKEEVPEITKEVEQPETKKKSVKTPYYLVKVNKFLRPSLSKYSVRIDTLNGYKELARVSREKAYKLAYDLNKVHGYNFERVFVEE